MKRLIIILAIGTVSCSTVEPIIIQQPIVKPVVIEVNPIVEAIDSADMYKYGR